MSSDQARQAQIKHWFDHTYATKGNRYLRSVQAYYVFLEMLRAQPQDALLDVACGLGRLLEAAREYQCQLTGVDISSVAVQKAQQQLPDARILEANAEALPFGDGEFKLVTCLGSLERMLNLDAVLSELLRVGQAQAKYCFLVRNADTLVWKWLKEGLGMRNDEGHQGAKSLNEWTGIFEQAGFHIERVYPDQYPLQRRKRWLSLGLADVKPTTILEGIGKIEHTGKFIFVLSKRHKE